MESIDAIRAMVLRHWREIDGAILAASMVAAMLERFHGFSNVTDTCLRFGYDQAKYESVGADVILQRFYLELLDGSGGPMLAVFKQWLRQRDGAEEAR